jgi:hypothetical protein
MPPTLTLTPASTDRPRRSPEGPLTARVARYRTPGEPPEVQTVEAEDAAGLVEVLFEAAAAGARVPLPALREVVENLLHADFEGAVVSVLDGGRTVRVTDAGPGIADPERALEPGFTTADGRARRVVRGVGSGLPLTAELMTRCGGRLEIAGGLAGGTVVTLSAPGEDLAEPEPVPGELERTVMALLLELGSAAPPAVARELGRPLPECGRALVLLEHRGLVARGPSGARSLTDAGATLVATLF